VFVELAEELADERARLEPEITLNTALRETPVDSCHLPFRLDSWFRYLTPSLKDGKKNVIRYETKGTLPI
jgi:hypothetical protein